MANLGKTGGLTLPAKIIIGIIVIAAIFFGVKYAKNSGLLGEAQQKAQGVSKKLSGPKTDVLNVLLYPFGGYAGGPYFNNGFEPAKDSRFFKEYGFMVKFHVADNEAASLEEWRTGKYDVHWQTIGAMSTKYNLLSSGNPKFGFLVDRSNKVDALVSVRGISNVEQLKGKRIAVTKDERNNTGNPSLSGLLAVLKANNMRLSDVIPVYTETPIAAAELFMKKKVHAAMVWAPDDIACTRQVSGAKVLIASDKFPNVIFDGMIWNNNKYAQKKKLYDGLAAGWLKGNGEINADKNVQYEAATILANGFKDGQSAEDYNGAIDMVRLLSYEDNMNLYELIAGYNGITAGKVFKNGASMYKDNSFGISGSWGRVSTTSALEALNPDNYQGVGDKTEVRKRFAKKEASQVNKSDEFASQSVRIRFSSGKASLSESAKTILDNKLSATLTQFETMRVMVKGHTDNVDDADMNKKLSYLRAKSVVKFFTNEYGFDTNRFVIVGAGEEEPIAPNNTKAGQAKNRRVEVVLLNN